MNKSIFKTLIAILIIIVFISPVLAYQQSYLEFQLDDSWNPVEQRLAAQTFEKNGLYLEVRNSKSDILSPEEMCRHKGCEVITTVQKGEFIEYLVKDENDHFIFSKSSKNGEIHMLSLFISGNRLNEGVQEMQKLYSTLQFKNERKFAIAHWEEKLQDPPELPFFDRHPIPWIGVIIVLIVMALTSFILWRKVSKKETQENTHITDKKPKKKSKK